VDETEDVMLSWLVIVLALICIVVGVFMLHMEERS